MSKLTVSEIKRQIAALEAKAARLVEDEKKSAIAKVRSLMESLGVTLDHLTSAKSRKPRATAKSASAARAGAGRAKYRDPKTGATWSGFGRAPAWIASAKSRDAFLVEGSPSAEPAATKKVARKAAKKAAGKAAVKPAKKAAAANKPAAGKALRTPAAKKAAPRKAAKKAAAVSAAPAPAPEDSAAG